MSNDQQLPLTRVRGVGPSAASRMAQCGVNTVEQLAQMSIAEFKVACPTLEKRAEAFVKGARRLLKRMDRIGAEQAADLLSSPTEPVAERTPVADPVPATAGAAAGVETEKVAESDEATGAPRLAAEQLSPEAGTKSKKEKKKAKQKKGEPAAEEAGDKKKKKQAAKHKKKDAGKSSDEKKKKEKKEKKQKKANKDKKEKKNKDKEKKDKKGKKSK